MSARVYYGTPNTDVHNEFRGWQRGKKRHDIRLATSTGIALEPTMHTSVRCSSTNK
jgi:hypothetical protein